MKSKHGAAKHKAKAKSKRNYCIAAIIIVVLAIIFVLAQQEPVSVNGKDKTVPDANADLAPNKTDTNPAPASAPTNEQVIAKLKPHLGAEPELENSSYKKSAPTIELLSKESLAKRALENPAVYAGAKAGDYEIRYNDLLVLFDYEADRISGIFIIDNVTIGNLPQN